MSKSRQMQRRLRLNWIGNRAVLSPGCQPAGRLHQGEPERTESFTASVAFHRRCDQKQIVGRVLDDTVFVDDE